MNPRSSIKMRDRPWLWEEICAPSATLCSQTSWASVTFARKLKGNFIYLIKRHYEAGTFGGLSAPTSISPLTRDCFQVRVQHDRAERAALSLEDEETMKSDNGSSSRGDSPQISTPWESFLRSSYNPQIVTGKDRPTRPRRSSQQEQTDSFSWKQLSFRRLSPGDRDGISPLLRYVLIGILGRFYRNSWTCLRIEVLILHNCTA